MMEGAGGSGATRRRRLFIWGAVAGAGSHLLGAVAYDFTADDAFITLRYARNWMDGLGLVFNAGERVEGYTSPLYLVLVAALGRLGVDLVDAARLLGLAASLSLVVLTAWWASRRPGRLAWTALAAPLLVGVDGTLAAYGLAGLETGLFALLVLATLAAAWREEARRKTGWASAVLAVLSALCRPEGVLVIAVVFGFRAMRARRDPKRRRPLVLWCAAVGAALVAFELWRLGYYGAWLPNTYYAKTGGGLKQASRGAAYAWDFLLDHASLFLLALAAGAWLDRRARAEVALLTGAAAALTLATIAEGGDGLPMYRFFVPVLAPAALLAARGLGAILERVAEGGRLRLRTAHAAGLAAGAALVAACAQPPRIWPYYERYRVQQERQIPAWSAAGRWLHDHAPAGASFAAVPIGAVSYYSGITSIDMLGLTDAHIARHALRNLGEGIAGHERHDAVYVLGRRPTFLLLGNINVTAQPTKGTIAMAATSMDWEGELLAQPDLKRLYRFFSARLDTGAYLNCLVLDGTRMR